MYINDLGIKEINQYYAQHGGRRTARIKNFANYMENAKAGTISAAKSQFTSAANTADKTAAATANKAGSTAVSRNAAGAGTIGSTTARTSLRTNAEQENTQNQTDSSSTDTANSKNACCDKCQLTNELMLRMLSNNLYTGGLGYSAMGSGALAAYQSLSKFFGNNVFS